MTLEILTSRVSVYEVEVDLGNLASITSREVPAFIDALLSGMPTLRTHRCVTSQDGGFVQEMRRGTDFAHVLEHVLLELEHLADPEKRTYRGWTRKKTETDPSSRIYVIHYEAKDFLSGRLAAALAVQLIKDLVAGQAANVEALIHHLEDPMAFLRKEESHSSQLLIPDIEILWESAKVAYQEAELTADVGAIDLPISKQTVLSGFSEQDRLTIRQSLEHLTPHLAEIQSRWLGKFAEFGGKYTELIQAPIESLGLSPLVQALENEQLDQYDQIVTQAGQQLARAEVPFSLVLHAVHLYEECLMSRLMQVFPDKEQLQNVWIGLDSLFHNHLLTISLAYFQQLHQGRSSRKESQGEGHST